MTARAVMVLGTTSHAGKSWLATALCRHYARQGLKVAPFKAQNMSNNARVVPGPRGRLGEIGSAQYFQALAANTVPDVRMNPVLLKPERDTASQVIVMGQVRTDLAAVPWRERSELLWPFAREALQALMSENDVVVLEGAGSPAEINLHANDYVNLRSALSVDAACLLVSDIDRGGAFAHLYGTHQLLQPAERALIRGFVLNRFRGDAGLLAPGPQQLEHLTGVPTVAVLPMWRGHGLPEEDGVFDDRPLAPADAEAITTTIVVIAYPQASNLDEFQALRHCPGVRVRWARDAAALRGADWIVLPGSKQTRADLAWLRAQGLESALQGHAAGGGRVLGICGGVQMLGTSLQDPLGVDGAPGESRGLGLLPLRTRFEEVKLLSRTRPRFGVLAGAWAALGELAFVGYEIRHGRTDAGDDAVVALRDEQGAAIGWQRGNVLGLYAHGLFESATVMRALFGRGVQTLDAVLDGLADFVDARFAPGVLSSLIGR